jgi:membrane protease YdiL (CAAX protease family)
MGGRWTAFGLHLALHSVPKAIVVFVLAWGALRSIGIPPRNPLLEGPRPGTMLPWSSAIGFLALYHFAIWRIGAGPLDRPGFQDVDQLTFVAGYLLRFAPSSFVEEITFRGFVFTALLSKFSMRVAFPVSLLLFATAHAYGGPQLVAHSLVVGGLFTAAYVHTKSIWPGFVLHTVSNLVHAMFEYGP